jgi:hypothetical protein
VKEGLLLPLLLPLSLHLVVEEEGWDGVNEFMRAAPLSYCKQ